MAYFRCGGGSKDVSSVVIKDIGTWQSVVSGKVVSGLTAGKTYLLSLHSTYVPPEGLTVTGMDIISNTTGGTTGDGVRIYVLKATATSATFNYTWSGGVTSNGILMELEQ